jgi:TatD DNase family protein
VKNQPIPFPKISEGAFFIDTHCHLDMDDYADDLEIVLERARQQHIRSIISIGIDEKSSRQAITLAGKYPMIKATVGIHPHNVAAIESDSLDILATLIEGHRDQVVGYGEIGLDYVKNYAPPDLQRRCFRAQLSLARELGLPVIIHDREAHADILRILRAEAPFQNGGVMHCFSGDLAFARQILELGFHLSIPGVVTFKNAVDLQETARLAPLTSLLLETDGPFLSPVPRRGRRNEPAFLLHTARMIAELRGISIDEVAFQTSANAMSLFRLTETITI